MLEYIDERGAKLSAAIREKIGNEVYGGPFKGTKFDFENYGGNIAPYLLGTYEHELHSVVETIALKKYKTILNIGCSFGYYAVGLAQLMPTTTIWCNDSKEEIHNLVMKNAELNNLTNVVCSKDVSFATDLIIMDVEGHELNYLKPDIVRPLNQADILVELHECMYPGIANEVIERFTKTHDIEIIYNEVKYFDLSKIFGDDLLHHFDNAIVTFEGRIGETPWAYMTCKN